MSGRPYEIVVGEVRRVLRDMPDASFDAAFGDPPYGLLFMGHRWDYTVPSVNVFVEVLRVLKPGAHALFFGGTRTFHRMMVNIEDAGFLPIDMCAWLYGSGFSKTIDIGKHIDRKKDTREDVLKVTGWIGATARRKGISNGKINDHFGMVGMAGHWTTTKSQPCVPTAEQWPELLRLLGEKPPPEIRAVARKVIREKGQPGDAWFACEKVGEEDAISGSYAPGQTAKKVRRAITRAAQQESERWSGYGNLLKPAWEPIGLFCKQHEGTIAENCLRYGTGGLDIDGTRVDRGGAKGSLPANLVLSHAADCVHVGAREVRSSVATNGSSKPGQLFAYGNERDATPRGYAKNGKETIEAYECVEDCPIRMLDQQSGHTRSPKHDYVAHRQTFETGIDIASRNPTTLIQGHADEGGASRFFYNAKVSREERDRGLEEFEARTMGAGALRGRPGKGGLDGGKAKPMAKNAHPTLKPIDLCRYYARLLLPPPRADGQPRRLLVPYSGAGSEMIGALQAGWDEVVGIELVPMHAKWALARIAKGRIIRHAR